jgi:serine/threonine-protein kinase
MLGLRPQVVYRKSSEPVNRVLEQAPGAGTSVRRNSHVSLVVSSGPNPQPATAVPNVVGEDQATAANNLRSAGFEVVVLHRPVTTSTQDGNVVDEQPHGGSSIPSGSQVTLFVGRLQGG